MKFVNYRVNLGLRWGFPKGEQSGSPFGASLGQSLKRSLNNRKQFSPFTARIADENKSIDIIVL